MASFSVGEAIGAGFRILRRTPWVVVAWGLVYLVLSLPMVFLLGRVMPAMIDHYQAMARAAGGKAAAVPPELPTSAFALQPVTWLTSLIAGAVIVGAIYRAVLEPEARRFAYLRLSRQELWLGL